MEKQELRLAVLIPEDLAKELDEAPPFTADGCVVERRIMPVERDAGQSLGFDPVVAHYAWLALKLAGSAATSAAFKVLFEDIFKRIKARQKGGQSAKREVTVRLLDGTQLTLPIDDPKALEEAIKKAGEE